MNWMRNTVLVEEFTELTSVPRDGARRASTRRGGADRNLISSPMPH